MSARISLSRPAFLSVSAATAVLVGATACTSGSSPTPQPSGGSGSSDGGASDGGTAAPSAPTVPGYEPGQIPPVPLIAVPPIGVLTDSAGAFEIDASTDLASVPGVTVTPTVMTDGVVRGDTVFYGDGSGSSGDGDREVINYGDGSGSSTDGDVSITNYGDGSGSYTDGTLEIIVYGDGSGSYTDDAIDVTLYGDGSGAYESDDELITNYGDGSGSYTTGHVTINNYGNGSANYESPTLEIINYGKGTAHVTSGGQTVDIPADPVPPVPKAGAFPSVEAIAPVEATGTLVTLDSALLFDFGKHEIRADAAGTLDALAGVLTKASVPALQIFGHTDSISDDAFNLELSQKRADAVRDALEERGVDASMETVGLGEGQPVAPNENPDGTDNPAGRAANRRVEIYIPAF
ncbi:MAG: OmpA family protein [Dermabacter sp.]|nr:OmpA family protein [Dermabacter sp.]